MIPPQVFDSIAYVSVLEENYYKPIGTCFFIHGEEEQGAVYVVTCRHVIREALINDVPLYIRMNRSDTKGVYNVPIQSDWEWQYPDSEDEGLVDLAILKIEGSSFTDSQYEAETKATTFAPGWVLGEVHFEFANWRPLDVGDEVVYVGMFENFTGSHRNYPVARFGKIALRPSEKMPGVERWLGDSEYYLVECQAYPGVSGSPVFVKRKFPDKERLFLVGVMVGFFKEDQVLDRKFTHYGLSLMIPGRKLAEAVLGRTHVEVEQNKSSELASQMRNFSERVERETGEVLTPDLFWPRFKGFSSLMKKEQEDSPTRNDNSIS
jgi:hypothetical protein